jgi:predicted RNase H-like HicB family nuclease
VIEREPQGGVFVVTVPVLAGCRTLGKTDEEAVRQGQDAIERWIDAVRYLGRPVPEFRSFDLGPDEDPSAEPAVISIGGEHAGP